MDDWEKRMHIMEVRLDECLLDIKGRQVKAPSSFQVIESVSRCCSSSEQQR